MSPFSVLGMLLLLAGGVFFVWSASELARAGHPDQAAIDGIAAFCCFGVAALASVRGPK